MEKITAVVLAAGAGKRMHSDVHKQYMMLAGRPVLFYALQAFAESAVTDIVVVVGAGEIDYCRKEIIGKYHIQKVCAVVEGGRERYHSVYEGLKAADGSDYVLIHDGARPFVTERGIPAWWGCRSRTRSKWSERMVLQKRRPSGAACGRSRPRRRFHTDGSGRRMRK